MDSKRAMNYLETNKKYLIISDVHGCIDELKALIVKNGFIIKGDLIETKEHVSIILLGDFIDKANHQKLKHTIEFIHKNMDELLLVRGNHEWYVYRYITNDPTLKIDYKKDKYYNTVSLLKKNEGLKNKFLQIYEKTFIWFKYEYSDDFSCIFTHAPCKKKYLQKSDAKSIKKMMKSKSRSKNLNVSLDNLLSYTKSEAQDNRHFHIYGHLGQPNIARYKNQICIDTSCIYGNYLSSLFIDGIDMTFDRVDFMNLQKSLSAKFDILFR